MNVKMVFGDTPTGLHHLRHRSHEPQVNERFWEGDPRRKPVLPPSSTSETSTSHPSITMEITPMDVESPNMSPDSSRLRFFPSMLGKHRSTPTTPAEESRYRNRLLDSDPVNGGGLPFDWKGMTFTVLKPSTDLSENQIDVDSTSTTLQHYPSGSAMLGDGISDEGTQLALSITPPSTPSFATPSLGSPTLTYSGRGAVKDASGTRRMMLKRKSSSFLRANGPPASQSSQSVVENGSRSPNNTKN